MDYKEITKRYNNLAESSSCLSCGGAVKYADVRPGEVCVDLGSGRGNDVIKLAGKTGEKGFVYGFDISDGMIAKSTETALTLGLQNVRFVAGPLERLDLPDATADIVISNCTINHSADKQAIWNEVMRVLKPGGRFVVSDIYTTKTVPEEYRNDPVAIAECWAGAVTRDEYLGQILKAGLSDISIIEESEPYEKGKIQVSSWTVAGKKLLTEKLNKMKTILTVGLIIKMFFLSALSLGTPVANGDSDPGKKTAAPANVNVVYLTEETFKKLVFDYDKNKEWKYQGNKPAIIDFYADWCAPCRQLSPIVEELAKEYSGKIVVYKVDTEKEKKLAQSIGISALPTLLFIPVEGKPQVSMGALPKATLVKAINDVLLVK